MIGPHPFHAVGEKYIAAIVQAADCLPLLIPVLEIAARRHRDPGARRWHFLPRQPVERGAGAVCRPGERAGHAARSASRRDHAVADPARGGDGVPVFGVCRGFQEMNVAMGGTLHQRVHEVAGLDDHREDKEQPLEVQYGPAHDVVLEPGSVLRGLAGQERIRVNSLHWQGVDRLGPDLAVEARATDGLVEAFRVETAPAFALAVQWHPEWQVMSNPFSKALFAEFGKAARNRAQKVVRIDSMANEIRQFLRDHGISEVEAIIPDMAGIARGKIMPAEKFAEDEGMRLPESIFLQTVTGDYPPDTDKAMSPAEIDIILKADPKTVRRVPWAAEPTAQVIHDCFYSDGRRVGMAPRGVLRHILEHVRATAAGSRWWRRSSSSTSSSRTSTPTIHSSRPWAAPAAPSRAARATASPRSTSSIRCSTTCTSSARTRTSRSTR